MKPVHLLLAAALAGVAVAGPALAQTNDTPRQGWGPGMMMGQGGMMGGMMGGRGWGSGMGPGMMGGGMMGGGCGMMMGYGDSGEVESYADGRVAFLEAELGITDAQRDVWNGYAEALRTNTAVMVAMHRKMRDAWTGDGVKPSGWLDLHIEMMRSRLAALEALKPATDALYAALSGEQKRKADRLLPVMGCM